MFNLYPHQLQALKQVQEHNKCAFYLDMGLGKTFVGTVKALSFKRPILLICPKSLVNGWMEYFNKHYPYLTTSDYTRSKPLQVADVFIITYDLIWRREIDLKHYTLMLDESSYIQNETSKRTKAILKLKPINVVLLSGTPTAGRYEKLYSQIKLLGWDITKKDYWNRYIDFILMDMKVGFKIPKVVGYKHIEELKQQLNANGCVFMKSEDVLDLPEQVDINIDCEPPKALETFKNTSLVEVDGKMLVGDMALNKLLYTRQLCSIYCKNKFDRLKDLIESTEDRLIIFYNFVEESEKIKSITKRPISEVNGTVKDLTNYENCSDSVTLIQYQSGSMGLNLQKANKIIYFSPTLSAEQFLQSKKRTHRLGQSKTCFYYYLICDMEQEIYNVLQKREDYTIKLFEGNL